jgi:hypothetical protein
MEGVAHFIMTRFLLPHIPSWVLFGPFEVVRTFQQAGVVPRESSGLVGTVRFLVERDGWSALFRGNSCRIAYSLSRFLCVVPLELIFMTLRPALHRLNVSRRHSMLIPVLLTLLLNQAYTYPITFIRNEMILRKRGAWGVLSHTLRSEGVLGLFCGLEGTYLGLIPSMLVFNEINRRLFYSRDEYDEIIRPLNLRLPSGHHLEPRPLPRGLPDPLEAEANVSEEEGDLPEHWGRPGHPTDSEEDEEEDIPLEEDDEDEGLGDEDLQDLEQQLIEMEGEVSDNDILLQIEITLAAMKAKHWRPFLKLSSRAIFARSCAKLSMRVGSPRDLSGPLKRGLADDLPSGRCDGQSHAVSSLFSCRSCVFHLEYQWCSWVLSRGCY